VRDLYPGYDVLSKRNTPSWNEQTRRVIDRRLAIDPDEHRFFSDAEWATLRALGRPHRSAACRTCAGSSGRNGRLEDDGRSARRLLARRTASHAGSLAARIGGARCRSAPCSRPQVPRVAGRPAGRPDCGDAVGLERNPTNFPVQYLGANVPQAWAAGSVFAFLQAIQGIRPYAPRERLYVDPALPDWLPDVTLTDLQIGNRRFDLRFWRRSEHTMASAPARPSSSLAAALQPECSCGYALLQNQRNVERSVPAGREARPRLRSWMVARKRATTRVAPGEASD
jgi:hypothetical protein